MMNKINQNSHEVILQRLVNLFNGFDSKKPYKTKKAVRPIFPYNISETECMQYGL